MLSDVLRKSEASGVKLVNFYIFPLKKLIDIVKKIQNETQKCKVSLSSWIV